jgi:hypothetical protein
LGRGRKVTPWSEPPWGARGDRGIEKLFSRQKI